MYIKLDKRRRSGFLSKLNKQIRKHDRKNKEKG